MKQLLSIRISLQKIVGGFFAAATMKKSTLNFKREKNENIIS